jgi:signal transduction histidine kinase/ligand-binding sensor domain-containing protein
MGKRGTRATGLWQVCRPGTCCWNSRIWGPLMPLLGLCLFSGGVPYACADDGQIASSTVQQAQVNPAVIRLPVIDGHDLRFARLSTAEGLSQTRVAQILQDEQGFMWFGTQYGLNRYDGYNFKLFVHDPRSPNSFSGVYIDALFKDRDGKLWVGCDQFLERLEPVTEAFTRYPVRTVSHISQDSFGILWLATGTGLYSLDPATGRIRQFSHDPKDPSSLSSSDIKSSGEDKKGQFWVVNSEGLDEFDRKTAKVILHIPLREPLTEFYFHEDRFGVFWIIYVSGNGLAVFDRKTNTLTRYSFYQQEQPSTAVTGVMAMLEDRNGTLWFGTQGAGLLKFDRDHQRFIRYRNDPADRESLPEDHILSLFEDKEGDIWASLGSLGVTRFSTKSPPFTSLHNATTPGGTNGVSSIYEDHQGILWLGTVEALNRIDRKARNYTSYRTSGPGADADVVSICEDGLGNLWVGTFNQGLHRFAPRTGHVKTYRHNPADPYSLSNNIVYRLLVDHSGTLWAATWDGLNRFDAATERFTTYKLDQQNKKLAYLDLAEDRKGDLWLGTHYSGLHHFDPATGKFTVYEHDINRPGTLSDNRVNSIHFDRSDTMWVGTQNGLNKLDPKTNTFTVYTQRDGLPGNAVSCILEDEEANLWISTNNGVARFNPQTNSVSNYSTADGLPGLDLTGWGGCFKSSSGEMFFSGFSGATAFFPAKVVGTPYTPPIVLTDFRLKGLPVNIESQSPLHNSISFSRDIILSHDQNTFSLTFSALSYSDSATNRYRYRLDGLDHDWNEVGSDRRQATYTTLPPGTYTFRAQGATSNGPWSEPGVALRVDILPPWWGTSWFRALSAALFLAILWTAYQFRVRQLAHQFDIRLEERVSERTRIARDLHDTLLQSFQGLLLQFKAISYRLQPGEIKESLDAAIGEASQAITEGRDTVQGLRASTIEKNDLAEAIRAIGEELASAEASQSPPTIHVFVEGTPRSLHPILRDEVYRIAIEALRNAFRHAQAHKIEVDLHYGDKKFTLSVRDNGRGIDREVLSADGRKGHFGLRGMRERAKLAGGEFAIWSEVDSGTEIELTIPASRAYTTSVRRFLWFRKPSQKDPNVKEKVES